MDLSRSESEKRDIESQERNREFRTLLAEFGEGRATVEEICLRLFAERGLLVYANSILHNERDAEDICQAVILKLGTRLVALGPSGLKGSRFQEGGLSYVYKAIYRKAVDQLRIRKKSGQATDDLLRRLTEQGPPSYRAFARWLLDEVDSEDRRLISLRFWKGLRWRAVAQHLGCSEDAARQRWSAHLRPDLEQKLNAIGVEGSWDCTDAAFLL
jgi:RNA polymerase sigma factor (sigma-70 family)